MVKYASIDTSERILMGPGPSNVHPRIYRALSAPVVGHLDPEFLNLMEENQQLLRMIFQTQNQLTLPMSGTGSAGMETCLVNVLEPGDRALICINGVFGNRMRDVAERCGAEVEVVDSPWGERIQPEMVETALSKGTFKVVGIVHAETSTGVLQPLEEISRLVQNHGALFLVDAVTSLGGVELNVDQLKIDLCYSGTQKCLSCPPGLAPITFSQRGLEVLQNRKTKVQSWYLDLSMIAQYWGEERVYHHTAPISMNYALREALLLIYEEGLQARWQRHLHNHQALVRGVEAMGLKMVVAPSDRLPSLNTVWIPTGVDDVEVRRFLLDVFNLEIGGGLGDFKGKAWRVGLMGQASSMQNVIYFLTSIGAALGAQGIRVSSDAAMEAALAV